MFVYMLYLILRPDVYMEQDVVIVQSKFLLYNPHLTIQPINEWSCLVPARS